MATPVLDLRLVSNAAQVRENHASYQLAITSPGQATKRALVDVIPYVISWIAIRDPSGKLSFAPSKFVGYLCQRRPMTGDMYEQYHQDMDGRQTEAAISDWIRVIARVDPEFEEAHDELFNFCAQLGKKPNGRCRISLLLDEPRAIEDASANKVPELLAEVYKSLPAAQQREVDRLIATR